MEVAMIKICRLIRMGPWNWQRVCWGGGVSHGLQRTGREEVLCRLAGWGGVKRRAGDLEREERGSTEDNKRPEDLTDDFLSKAL